MIDRDMVTVEERDRLLRLCAYLSGSLDAAEDLTQETLIEAWKHEASLRERERRWAWLTGIARNVCKRWLRHQGRLLTETAGLPDDADPAGDWDIEADLEHAELAQLLDQAMALLPADTRTVLVARFIEELPHAEIAQRLRLSEGAIKVRVHRGKLALRRLLSTEFAPQLDSYGFPAEEDAWKETQIWCMGCGSRRLQMRVSAGTSTISFRCPHCDPAPQVASNYPLHAPQFASMTPGVTRPGAILRRGQEWCREYFADLHSGGTLPCTRCGAPMPIELIAPGEMGPPQDLTDRLQATCPTCGDGVSVSRTGLVTVLPQIRELRRRETRLRILPPRQVEAEGRPAIVTSIDSVAGPARIDVVTDVESYRVITVQQSGMPGQI